MSNKTEEILLDPNKQQRQATGMLSILFRRILADLNYGPYLWNQHVNRYLSDPRNGIPANGKDRSSARGNLQKELFRDAMTFKVFRKGLMLLAPLGIVLEVRLEWKDRTTVHTIRVENNNESIEREYDVNNIEDEDEDSDEIAD